MNKKNKMCFNLFSFQKAIFKLLFKYAIILNNYVMRND